MAAHNELGKWGEDLAAEYLEAKGYRILHRNWSYQHKDIDIACLDTEYNTLVFVEVKTRSTDFWGRPDEAITLEKKRNVLIAAKAYTRENYFTQMAWRYDSISIVGTPTTSHTITHKQGITDMLDIQRMQNIKSRSSKNKIGTWGCKTWRRW